MSDTLTVPMFDLLIDRGRDVIAVSCPKHEIEVLRAVHGVKEVQLVGPCEDDRDLDSNADAEMDRLRRAYHRANAPDVVRIAFPMGASQLEPFGFLTDVGPREEVPQSGVRKHPKPAKIKPAK